MGFTLKSVYSKIMSIIENHKFFVRESKNYVGKPRLICHVTFWGMQYTWENVYSFKDKLYYPIAYIKFMWLCWKDK
jgi:hypothetical protein